MKNVLKLLGFIALVAVIGFSMAACKNEDDGGSDDPASTKITWSQSGKNYALVCTEITSSTATYILSVGTDGYNVGIVTFSGTNYSFSPDPTVYGYVNSNSFTMTINATNVVTSAPQPISVINSSGTISGASLPVTDAVAVMTDNTGGKEYNPFVGSWTGEGVSVSVSKNLTWSASAQGYKNSGSYANIEDSAIIYDSKGKFFGYAYIVFGAMETMTFDGGYITFTKK